jgi:ADP-ribose pyrophosphatase
MGNFREHNTHSKQIYKGNIVTLCLDQVTLPDGRSAKREVVRHAGGVTIVPYTTEGEFVLVEQYRYAIGQMLLEFPAGRLQEGEDPLMAASRELMEETGFRPGKLEPLGSIFTAPGFCDECLHIYLATDLVPGEQSLEEDEFLNVLHLSKHQLVERIRLSHVHDAKTLAAWSFLHKEVAI